MERDRQEMKWCKAVFRLDSLYYETGLDMGLVVLVRQEDNVAIGHAGLVPRIIDGEQGIEIGNWLPVIIGEKVMRHKQRRFLGAMGSINLGCKGLLP